MQLGHTVYGMAANNGQVGHAYAFFFPLFDKRHTAQAIDVIRIETDNVVQKAPVDLVNDLQVTWQHMFQHTYAPAFKCFRQDGMIGVGKRFLAYFPGFLPIQLFVVDKNTHKFGYG